MKKISVSEKPSPDGMVLLDNTLSIATNDCLSLGGANSVEAKQIFCNVERYLSKIFFPILIVGFFFASANIFAEEEYLDPNLQFDASEIPEPCPSDCNVPWSNDDKKPNHYYNGYYETHYFNILYSDNGDDYDVPILVTVINSHFTYRINCDGLLEIQLLKIVFGERDDMSSPAYSKVPIKYLIKETMKKILDDLAGQGILPVNPDGSVSNQIVQTTMGTCWAIVSVPSMPITVGTMSIGGPEESGEGITVPKYYVYVSPCNNEEVCCSQIVEISRSASGEITMTSVANNIEPTCENYTAPVSDNNNNLITPEAICSGVCDWLNFECDIIPGIHSVPESSVIVIPTVNDNQLNVEISTDQNYNEIILFKIIDSYGNILYAEQTNIYNGKIITSSPLPAGNYLIGIFNPDNSVIYTGSFSITNNH